MGYLILSALYLLFFSLCSLVMFPLTALVRRKDRLRGDRMSLRYVQWGFRCVTATLGIRLTVQGREKIPEGQAVLYMVNHRSIYDTVVTYSQVPDLTGYIAKDEMAHVPVITAWMRRLYCLFLPREDIRQSLQVILDAIRNLEEGISMTIFPEGTRNKGEEPLLPFRAGSFKPAERVGCPIVPVAVSYDGPVLEQMFPHIRGVRAVVTFGDPIETSGLSREGRKELPGVVRSAMLELLREEQRALK